MKRKVETIRESRLYDLNYSIEKRRDRKRKREIPTRPYEAVEYNPMRGLLRRLS